MSSDLSNVTHIIFDWDGTIMDSVAKIVNCMQKSASMANLPVPSTKQVEHIVGISLLPAIQQLFDVEQAKAKEVRDYYKQVFMDSDQTPCPLFDGAHSLLSGLSQHYTLGVATGKARRGLHRAFEMTDSARYFNATRCADEAESKPSSDMLLQLLDAWQIKPDQAVMIGDTTYDMQMAQSINMPRIGVSYGVHDKQALQQHRPLHIVDALQDLHDIFLHPK